MVGITPDGTFVLILTMVVVLTLAIPIVAFVPTKNARSSVFMLALVSGLCLYLGIDTGPDDRFGLASFARTAVFAVWLCCVTIAGLAIVFRHRRDTEPTLAGNIVFGAVAGLPVPLLLFLKTGIFTRIPGAFLAVALAAAAGILVYQAFAGLKDSRRGRPFDAYGCTCLFATMAIALSLALSYISADVVARKAIDAAAGRPYCLQSGSRTVTSLFDLSILTFRERKQSAGNTPSYLRNHGLLVVKMENGLNVLNWSYHAQDFMTDALAQSPNLSAQPQSLCTPISSSQPTNE
ncbi:hypothetical protein B5M44_19450 [Shinella sumterensis]|uniref:hypothetical protein n=1 Tax=Shinella sumterensis TaxID=1967501 RepID=UPI00106E24C7|nr:hypothetical protein [Shinella sumterensis]MCD1266123.1 hypothetical protein [Shinella sumterensis]TFE96612.1 hypothetical protein B5M44_19450 [Shinella sumterensis]